MGTNRLVPSPRRLRRGALLVVAALAVGPFVAVATPSAGAVTVFGQACPPGQNEIACENARPGSPESEWDISGFGDFTIQGFSTEMSASGGQRVDFKIDTDAADYRVDIYRLGWYGGDGARKVATVAPSAALPQTQPACLTEPATNLVDCGNWAVSASWTVPTDAVSGVYVAKPTRTDTGGTSHIVFVVRDDDGGSDVVFQTADTTWQAYNLYGGANFYYGDNGRATKLSYNRPVTVRGNNQGRDFLFSGEYPLIRFLERNGHDVSYISGIDAHRDGASLLTHRVFVSAGHDEYWSGAQRANVEAARDAGVNLAFFSGNEVYWRTRYEPSIDGSAASDRTLVCYKETWDNAKSDPADEWTGTWRDPRYATPAQGAGLPENALTGTAYMSNHILEAIEVPAADGRLRMWRNTTVASQSPGQVAVLAPNTLGYESNEDLDNGFRPAGLVRLSTTTKPTPEYLQDFGNRVAPGETTHHMTMYRADSGALVFSAGTIQWAWGLDPRHDGDSSPADPRMQQATLNLFADLGARPTTLMSGMVMPTASTDTTPPTTTITSPTPGTALQNGATVTVTGTAADVGGVVAAVEVSLDGGVTWHPAEGRGTWTYTGTITGAGDVQVLARAVDDSLNRELPGAAVGVTVSCPCSLFGDAEPGVAATTDTAAVELGVRVVPDRDGWIEGVRFYKGPNNTGTHTGTLWSASGTQLATGTFEDETATGWQEMRFDAPVPVVAGTTYIASYFAPAGGYHARTDAFWLPLEVSPLTAPATTTQANGLFATGNRFPTETFRASNYFVDVLFSDRDTAAPGLASRTPGPGAGSIPVTSPVTVGFSELVDHASVSLTLTQGSDPVPAALALVDEAGATRATLTPGAALAHTTTYTVTVAAEDLAGNALAPVSWSFTTSAPPGTPGVCPCGLFEDVAPPGATTVDENVPIELGLRFAADRAGYVTGVQFYKAAGNDGVHVGTLWDGAGQQLARATVTGETTSGWQQVLFDEPVLVDADRDYLVSYTTPGGVYSATAGGLASSLTVGPLRSAERGGAYAYSAGAFPAASSSTDYGVDVVFQPLPPVYEQPVVVATLPQAGAVQVAPDTAIHAQFAGEILAGSAQIAVTERASGAAVAGTAEYSAASLRLSFAPDDPLAEGRAYRVSVSGAQSVDGTKTMDPVTWDFTVSDDDRCPCTLFSGVEPAEASIGDTDAVELGTRFVPQVDGRVTAIRFLKGPRNTGTHTGTLWSATGTALAQVTFTGESESGWQTAALDTPVDVTAGTQYVVSYFAPRGGYAATVGFFGGGWTRGPLAADGTRAGVYAYGGGFPTLSWQSSNYFVDVAFEPTDATPPSIAERSPAPGATSVGPGTRVEATFSEPVSPTSVDLTVDAGAGPVAGAAAYDEATRTVSFQPTDPLPSQTLVTVSVAAADYDGEILAGTTTWTFTTGSSQVDPGTCDCTLFGPTDTPAVAAVDDSSRVELGMRVVPAADGLVTGVRFWKGAGNTGTHVGTLWSAAGQALATVTFTAETESGWQQATFDSPVPVTGGTEYTVSYLAPVGRYANTPDYFTSPVTRGSLTAPASAGVYRYGGGFPTSSWRNGNYWVDVVFEPTGGTP
jgi:Domain of unknown function (DUF4082)/Bacterial Ig-like domain/Bacterial Ig domain